MSDQDKLNPLAERGFLEVSAVLMGLGVPPHSIAEAALVNCVWHAKNTGNRLLTAQRLRAAAELLERQEATNGR